MNLQNHAFPIVRYTHSNNNDSGQGAAIHAQTKANLNLIHPTFIKNYALALGAAVFIDNSNAYIAQGLFSNNTFGAVYVKEADSAVAFYDNLFIGNHGPVVVECSGRFFFSIMIRPSTLHKVNFYK